MMTKAHLTNTIDVEVANKARIKRRSKNKSFVKLSTIKMLHKWLSLLVFIQLFIWLGTGLFFNLMDHDKARGSQYLQALTTIEIDHHRLVNITELLAQSSKPVVSVDLVQRLSQPYYLLSHEKGLYQHLYQDNSLINAYSGQTKQVDDVMAQAIAKASYSGSADVVAITLVHPPIADLLKEKNSVWQVDFADEVNTSVYVNANSARLIAHSNDDKRFVDFFFMLHFMDYSLLSDERGFNNWQIMFFALITLLFCLTGLIWTIELAVKGRYKWS